MIAAAANGNLAEAAAAESDDDRVFERICVVWHKQLRRFLEVPKRSVLKIPFFPSSHSLS